MKLGLLGYPITHSESPRLYAEFLGASLTSYELFSFKSSAEVPDIHKFSEKLDGLNITSPYKKLFLKDVKILSPIVKAINSINTVSFTSDGIFATNTDLVAVVEILKNYQKMYGVLHLILLGDGAMGSLTKIVAEDLGLSLTSLSRKIHGDISHFDLTSVRKTGHQNIIINACSRDFVFDGRLSSDDIFWDYNYSFKPHQNTLPSRVRLYQDGLEMLERQARAAVQFWLETNPKLK